jgi:hypothetical protein
MDFDEDYERLPPKRKRTRKWCKGRVGVEHEPMWRDWHEMSSLYAVTNRDCPMLFECVNCQKHLDIWYPKPSWYTGGTKSMWDSGPRPEVGSTEPRKKKK